MNSQSKQRRKQDYDATQVIKLVDLNKEQILKCKGKDIVIVFGLTTYGKSTLIAASKYGHLKLIKIGTQKKFVKPDGSEIDIEIGVDSRGNSCTIFPCGYDISNIIFVDTRGFADVRGDICSETASALLLKMAVDLAASIKIVIVDTYSDFKGGMVNFQRLGIVLSKIFKNSDIPAYFLFNRFTPASDELDDYCKMSPCERQEYIIDQIRQQYANLKQGCIDVLKIVSERVKERLSECYPELMDQNSEHEIDSKLLNDIKSLIESDEEYQHAQNNLRYIPILEHNFAQGNFGYYEPADPSSVTNFLSAVTRLQPCPKDQLVFKDFSEDITKFQRQFEETLTRFSSILQGNNQTHLFTEQLITSQLTTLHEDLQAHESALADITEHGNAVVHLYEEKYLAENRVQLERCNKELTNLQTSKCAKQKIISDIDNLPPEVYWEDQFCVKPSLTLWASHTCHYPYDIPYFEVKEEDFNEFTQRIKEINTESPNFEVEYSSFQVSNLVKASLAGLSASVISFFVAGPAGIIPAGFEAAKIFTEDCKGHVKIMVEPKNIPSNIAFKEKTEQEINLIEKQISAKQAEHDNIANVSTLSDKISLSRQLTKENIAHLETFAAFSKSINMLYEKEQSQISVCSDLVKLLYDEHCSSLAVTDFRTLLTESNPLSSSPTPASNPDLDPSSLASMSAFITRELQKFYPNFKGNGQETQKDLM